MALIGALTTAKKVADLKTAQAASTTPKSTPTVGSNIANYDPNNTVHQQIADLGQQWAAAAGNKDLQKQLHEQANALRNGVGGSYDSKTGVHTLGTQVVAAPPQQSAGGTGNTQSYIDQLNNAKRNQVMADLAKSRDSALSNLAGEKSAIAPKYYEQRNQVSAGAQQKARNFAEYMQARGGTSSGANAQATLMQNMTTQGNLGSLGRQEAADFSDIERRTTGVNNAFASDVASANAGIEADRMNALLQDYYNEQQRQLQIAGLMGAYNGQRTLQGQQFDASQTQQQWENKFNYGNATGTFSNGQQTLQKATQDWNQAFQQGQFDFQKAQTAWENNFKDKSFQQSMEEAAASRGLQWASLGQREREFVADQAFREKTFASDQEWKQKQYDWETSSSNPSNISAPTTKEIESSYLSNLNTFDNEKLKSFFTTEKSNIVKDLGIEGYNRLYGQYYDQYGLPKKK